MSEVATLQVSTDEFKQALRDYSTMTSQDGAKMLNGKCRDLMFRCYKNSPVGSTRSQVRSSIHNLQGVAAYRLRKQTGGVPSKAVLKAMVKKIGKGKGYAKSAWIKAVNKIPKNEHAAYGTPPMGAAKFIGATAKVRMANANSLNVYMVCGWASIDSSDRSGKQRIAEKTIASQMGEASKAMYSRMRDKMAKNARKVSAKR